jgi:hypothetical protein
MALIKWSGNRASCCQPWPTRPQLNGRFRSWGRAFLILMQQQCAATDSFAKPPAELPECAAGGSRGNLGVDLHRDGDLAVPKDLHGHPGMHVKAPAGPLAPPTRRARLRSRYGGTEPVGWREKRKETAYGPSAPCRIPPLRLLETFHAVTPVPSGPAMKIS